MNGIREGLLNAQDLLIVVTSLDVARDDALGAEGLARLRVEKLVTLHMVRTHPKVLELLIFAADRVPSVVPQNGTSTVELTVATVAQVDLVIDAVPGGLDLLGQGLVLDCVCTHEVAHLVDRRHYNLAGDLVDQAAPLLVKDAIAMADVVVLAVQVVWVLSYVDRVVDGSLQDVLQIALLVLFLS